MPTLQFMAFEYLFLLTMIDEILKRLDIAALNEMQESALAASENYGDMVLLSPTGSGKTLAFLLPVLQKLNPSYRGVQALVLTPSRELALQIEQVFRQMGTGFKVNCCYGGHPMKTEMNNLRQPPALLIGTPGRIADHLRRESFDPRSINMLVLDEFDKSLELGFKTDMAAIIGDLTRLKQRILTSATQAIKIPEFAGMDEPVELNFIQDERPKGLAVKTVMADGNDKLDALFRLICKLNGGATLVFCNHREAVERISELLGDMSIVHDVFHGGLKQEDRERALIKFRNGSHRLLICTDLASRGLDIPDIEHVIHYQLPGNEAAYVHRNGRTARMHASGTAYLVLSEKEYIPEYLEEKPTEEKLPEETMLPELPEWATLYIGGGKKDKINKIDIVGLLFKKGNLQKDELGLIEVQDHAAYAAVKADKIGKLVKMVKHERVKKKKVKIAISH